MKPCDLASPMTLVFRAVSLLLLIPLFLGPLAPCEKQTVETRPPMPAWPQADANAPAAEQFAAVRAGSSGGARVYGSYTKGCIAGAKQLSLDAPRWQVMHPSRNRAWGHPELIRFVDGLAAAVASDGYRGLLIGDLVQPRGGPLPSDHNSHQVGLDADIWLTPLPASKLSASALETFEPPSMVDFDRMRVNDLFGAAQVAMISRAAKDSDVERIFVSPPIKKALCERAKGDR